MIAMPAPLATSRQMASKPRRRTRKSHLPAQIGGVAIQVVPQRAALPEPDERFGDNLAQCDAAATRQAKAACDDQHQAIGAKRQRLERCVIDRVGDDADIGEAGGDGLDDLVA